LTSAQFGVLELLAFFAIPIAFCLQQLWSLRRERRRDAASAIEGDEANGASGAAPAPQGAASEGRGTDAS
jgi:hypothetical protein